MPVRVDISQTIWQSYTNAILDYFQRRTYCEAKMDDLQLFILKKESHMAKLDLLKSLLKNGLKVFPMKCQ